MNEKCLTPEELVARFRGRVTAATLKTWRWQSKGPIWSRIGGRVLYAVADVEAWEAQQRKGSTKEVGR